MKSYALTALITLASSAVFAQPISTPTHCTDSSRECVIEAATAYLNGIVAHDPTNIPLADDVQRWENGINTANNADKLRDSIKNDIGIKTVTGVRELRWFVDGNQVIGFFLMDSNYPWSQKYFGTTHIVERFQVENGMIKEVENVFCASPNSHGQGQEPSKIPGPTSLSFICNRL